MRRESKATELAHSLREKTHSPTFYRQSNTQSVCARFRLLSVCVYKFIEKLLVTAVWYQSLTRLVVLCYRTSQSTFFRLSYPKSLTFNSASLSDKKVVRLTADHPTIYHHILCKIVRYCECFFSLSLSLSLVDLQKYINNYTHLICSLCFTRWIKRSNSNTLIIKFWFQLT